MKNTPHRDETGSPPEKEQSEFRGYTWGYVLSLILSLPPFALVKWSDLSTVVLGSIIGAAALLQMAVHFRFFLHIRLKGQAQEDFQLILFAALLLILMGGGTIWILFNLRYRMM